MTIPEWLESATLTNADIARHCGVDSSQLTRWRQGNVPHGAALLKLIALSGNRIDDVPVRKRGPEPKTKTAAKSKTRRRTRRSAA